jgi:hypothetical protein
VCGCGCFEIAPPRFLPHRPSQPRWRPLKSSPSSSSSSSLIEYKYNKTVKFNTFQLLVIMQVQRLENPHNPSESPIIHKFKFFRRGEILPFSHSTNKLWALLFICSTLFFFHSFFLFSFSKRNKKQQKKKKSFSSPKRKRISCSSMMDDVASPTITIKSNWVNQQISKRLASPLLVYSV